MPFLKVRLGQRSSLKPRNTAHVGPPGVGTRRIIVLDLLGFAATIAATAFGYVAARRFVRERLKFVDAAQTWRAPVIGGLVAWAVAVPVVWIAGLLLPVGGLTA